MQTAGDYNYERATAGSPTRDMIESTVRHAINADETSLQIEEISVSGAGNNATIAVTINGVEITYDTDSDATVDESVQGLTDAINDEPLVNGYVRAAADVGNDTVTVTEIEGAGAFSIAESQDPNSNLSISQTQAHATPDPIPFGLGLVRTGYANDGELLVTLPDASSLTARDLQVTLDAYTDGDYRLVIRYDGGQEYVAEVTESGADIDTTLQDLRDDINNNGPGVLDASVDTGASPSELHIVAETAGFADFEINDAQGPEQLNASVATPGDDIRQKFVGLAMRTDALERQGESSAQYDEADEVNVLERGEAVVATEDAASEGSRLWLRLATNGNNDQRGAFRHSFDSGAVPIPYATLRSTQKLADDKVNAEVDV